MARACLLFLPLVLTWLGGGVSGIDLVLEHFLTLEQYDGALRPQALLGVTEVNVSMELHSLLVDETRQVLEVSGHLVQEWNDPGLKFSHNMLDTITVTGISGAKVAEKLWRPDLSAAKQVKVESQDAFFIRIKKDGQISWAQRVHYDFPCKLKLASYPLSQYECTLTLTSLGYTDEELHPKWHPYRTLEYKDTVVSHGYKLTNVRTDDTRGTDFLNKPCRQLQVILQVSPRSGWAVKHTVVPMMATVTTSYLSFYINIRGACARMLTVMLSLVTAAIFHESTYRKVPPAHETMAIEVFTGTCLAFIFLAALETVVVEVLSHPSSPVKGRRSSSSNRNSFALEVRDEKPDLTDDRSGGRGVTAAIWLDRCSRVLYPAAFLAFNAVYWVIYS